ncbi:CRE_HP_G0128750.mRNA.1.CDS.1 [Saccharomyces cerevisiae]|nr:CRE_HP_G0032850.mRNA.1.CDS.1 [Saccharomyces cerevisiae]CAI4973648.1 CRE_HP_G0052620.mRNA.1.CDS.1 [Saccharomyces cerevisiae]CAI5109482.1 CRE_HP_G0128750.mRNA.1.CDS.1 [Saccharomyces cerevisiae]CAI6574562.1 CRE_HP_G0032850.mRNA.1.CDS.1 [Saccharomyces cerevisiae]CAI6763682.1 CRE_HP_G0052620.mRNA.1.CDS.1 [Saccharomyces cerevisiae]
MFLAKNLKNNKIKVCLPKKKFAALSTASIQTNERPNPDKVLKDITKYVHETPLKSSLALDTARLCFLDTLGCGLAALKFKQAQNIIKPIVPGTIVPSGAKILGTSYVMDPVKGAFAIGTLIRWLDYNDCWLAAEWGHPSDNLGGILAVADHLSRLNKATHGKNGKQFLVKDVLEAMIKAHEIQGIIALENSFNKVGLDHVVLVKVATAGVVSKMLGLSQEQTIEALSQAFVDGQSLRTYRHAPNTGSRKSWAAGDAVSRAVNLAYLVKNANVGTIPSVLTARTWGFYDVLFKGKPFSFQQRSKYDSYVMENVLFKISFPAEFHAQTAVEAAVKAYRILTKQGKTFKDIKSIRIRTQEAAMRIIDKSGPLYNYADRDHCIQYMIAVPLITGNLTATDYSDEVARNPEIDNLRSKMYCIEDTHLTQNYHDPDKRSIGNALLIELNDGTQLDEIFVEYPVGHKFRREEGIPLLMNKFQRHLREHFVESPDKVDLIMKVSSKTNFLNMQIDKYMDLFTEG